MVRIAALDDMNEWLETEERITNKYFADCKEEYIFCKYDNVNRFLLDLDEGVCFDIYLLDIELPETNGLHIAREIKKKYLESLIIYITGYVEYAIEAFEVNAYRYIPKKLLEEKLPDAYTSLLPKLVREEGPCYMIETNSRMERIVQRDIYYIQKDKKYVVLTQKDGSSRVRATLDEVYGELEQRSFVRIDKGTVANLRHIMKLEKRCVKMRNGEYLSVSQPQLATVKRRISEYWRVTWKG